MQTHHKLGLFFGALMLLVGVHYSIADQAYFTEQTDRQATRACSFESVTPQQVTVTGTSASTASATGKGLVRVLCSTKSHMAQGAYGATGPTATTGGVTIPPDTPEYVYSKGGKFSFVRDTTSGTCEVSDCR